MGSYPILNKKRKGSRAVALAVQLPKNLRFSVIPRCNSGSAAKRAARCYTCRQLPENLRFSAILRRNSRWKGY